MINKYQSQKIRALIGIFYVYLLFVASAVAGENTGLEIGFEHTELAQNNYRNLGFSNYTFFVGGKFETDLLEDWAWRLSLINVELSNEHLKDKKRVCCINGDRSNLEGKLEQYRLYVDYLPYTIGWGSKKSTVNAEMISSLAVGYNRWVTSDIVRKDEHDVRAITVGGLFRFKTTFYKRIFIEPALDVGLIVYKNKDINSTVGDATLDRPEHFTFTLLVHFGYAF